MVPSGHVDNDCTNTSVHDQNNCRLDPCDTDHNNVCIGLYMQASNVSIEYKHTATVTPIHTVVRAVEIPVYTRLNMPIIMAVWDPLFMAIISGI